MPICFHAKSPGYTLWEKQERRHAGYGGSIVPPASAIHIRLHSLRPESFKTLVRGCLLI